MFKPEDFEVPLEKQLKMRIVYDEIDNCDNIKELKEQLKACADQLMKYQHLLSVALRNQLVAELEKWDIAASKIVREAMKENDGSTRST